MKSRGMQQVWEAREGRAVMSALAALIMMGAPALASAQEQAGEYIEYKVKKGDNCIRIARNIYGDGGLCYDLIAASNEFDAKFHVYPGQVLKLPTKEQIEKQRQARLSAEAEAARAAEPAPEVAPEPEPEPEPSSGKNPDARLASARGEVQAREPGAESWERAARGKNLWRQWRVNSEADASADIFFTREKATLRMRENTLVVIYGKAEGTAPSTTRHATLESGALATRLGELAGGGGATSSVQLETPAAVVDSEGGETLVSVLDGGTTLVANHTSPKTSVRGRTKRPVRVVLPENTGSRIEPGKDPSPPRPLPSPPAWQQPEVRGLALGGVSKVSASWGRVPDAAVWRVELRRLVEQSDAGQAVDELLGVRVLDAAVQEAVFEDIAPGAYQLRIATIDSAGFEGRMSDPLPLIIHEALMADARPSSAERAERLTRGELYQGEQLRLSESLQCKLDGKRISENVLDAVKAGNHELACKDASGAALPIKPIQIKPNALTALSLPSEPLLLGEVILLQVELEHELDAIDVYVPPGFELIDVPHRNGARWDMVIQAVEPDKRGDLRIGTRGLLGATLLEVPLQSASLEQSEVAAEKPPEKPLRLMLGAHAGLRSIFDESIRFGDNDYTQGWRFGARVGLVWRQHAVFELELDTGLNDNVASDALGDEATMQTFSGLGALSYRIGPWPVRPFLRMAAGGEWSPSQSSVVPVALVGAGVDWLIEERVELRLDLQQLFFFDGTGVPVQMPSVTLGFAGTF